MEGAGAQTGLRGPAIPQLRLSAARGQTRAWKPAQPLMDEAGGEFLGLQPLIPGLFLRRGIMRRN